MIVPFLWWLKATDRNRFRELQGAGDGRMLVIGFLFAGCLYGIGFLALGVKRARGNQRANVDEDTVWKATQNKDKIRLSDDSERGCEKQRQLVWKIV